LHCIHPRLVTGWNTIYTLIQQPQLNELPADRNGEHGAGHSMHADVFVVELSENKKRLVMADNNV
jgi:hypothetical protein